MSEQGAAVGRYSEGVKALIEDLEAEARGLVPQFIMVETKYRLRIQDGITNSMGCSSYELRSSNSQKPDPIELIGPIYDFKSKKLRLYVHATYELNRKQKAKEGVQDKGVWFSATVERNCDLIPWVVSRVKLPTDFRIYCRKAVSYPSA